MLSALRPARGQGLGAFHPLDVGRHTHCGPGADASPLSGPSIGRTVRGAAAGPTSRSRSTGVPGRAVLSVCPLRADSGSRPPARTACPEPQGAEQVCPAGPREPAPGPA